MRKRVLYGSGLVLLAVLVTLVVWQGSFDFGDYGPRGAQQTYFVWAVSTLTFLLTVALGFMLTRNFVKLYFERHSNREGSRIRTKLVIAALGLTSLPAIFLVVFSIYVMNRNIEKWFTQPAQNIRANLIAVGNGIEREAKGKSRAQAELLVSLPEVQKALRGEAAALDSIQQFCTAHDIDEARVDPPNSPTVFLCRSSGAESDAAVEHRTGNLVVRNRLPLEMARTQAAIQTAIREHDQRASEKRAMRWSYLQIIGLITLFILFVATWLALFYAKQISVPISALLGAANQVRGGNLSYRVRTGANDELASLVRAFNEMTADLETNSRELENRRRFTEAILESIPTGVVSLTSDGRIQRVNRALSGIVPAEQIERATRLEHLFAPEEAQEIRYLMNRARRLGIAAAQLEVPYGQRTLNISATVAALDEKVTSGFVLVLEDTSDLLRAQKTAAWNEVARRIAHEIKNPLTPIALSAERIIRYLHRGPRTPETDRVLQECSSTILHEVESVKNLVDEFSQFARFPAAQPVVSDLNEVVDTALSLFAGRLDGIELHKDLAPSLPPVNIDREQFKRLVVNLVDNAAEAMQNSPLKRLYVGTSAPTPETVELTIADTGCGISPEDKQKLFLPYFSTKNRGTGLGLAIVNHIVNDHNAQIRVESNSPAGARFTVEIAAIPQPADTTPHEAAV